MAKNLTRAHQRKAALAAAKKLGLEGLKRRSQAGHAARTNWPEKYRSKPLKKIYVQFLELLQENFSQRAAARILGIPESNVNYILNREDVKAQWKQMEQDYIASFRERDRAKEALAHVDYADAEVMQMIRDGEGEKKKGRLSASRLFYQRHGLVEVGGAKATANAGSAALLAMAASGNAPKLYQAQRFAKPSDVKPNGKDAQLGA